MMVSLTAWKSSLKDLDGSAIVVGNVTARQLKPCGFRMAVTLSQTLALCQAPGTKTSVGFGDIETNGSKCQFENG